MEPKPFFTGYLPEADGHQIYYEQYGNIKSPAILILHGGPGSKSKPRHIKPFDLNQFHVVTFHQRGCGKSLPLASLEHNTTLDLLKDIERLRKHLQINQWFVSGGSWGATLALIYAENSPTVVTGLLLSSIFLARQADLAWSFTQAGGVDHLFPDLWADRVNFLSQYHTSPQNVAHDLLLEINSSPLEKVQQIVAGIANWEGNLISAQSDLSFLLPEDVDEDITASVKISLHYEANRFWLKNNEILANIQKIQHIPTIIAHGRHDVLCPANQAWELHTLLPSSELLFLPTSNHHFTADGLVAQRYAYRYFLQKVNAQ
ncbi:MAG: alpha/beta fold hydrolase [bacterium]